MTGDPVVVRATVSVPPLFSMTQLAMLTGNPAMLRSSTHSSFWASAGSTMTSLMMMSPALMESSSNSVSQSLSLFTPLYRSDPMPGWVFVSLVSQSPVPV